MSHRRRWLWVVLGLLIVLFIYVWAFFSINERQTRLLAERIRTIYSLPRSEYHFPNTYLSEVVRPGMGVDEVAAAIDPIRQLIERVTWHTDYSVDGHRWVAERLLVQLAWAPDAAMDIFFYNGKVSHLDSGYYISDKNEISADSAGRLLH